MNKWIVLIVLVAVIGITAVGFTFLQSNTDSTDSSDDASEQETVVQQPEESAGGGAEVAQEAVATGTIITSADSAFGAMLFDGESQAIYIWELEETATAECYGSCAAAWPPVLTDGPPRATGSVNGALLGTTERTDGTTQVTYNGHPLYYYAHEAPGEVKCHNISTHGGLWWVIQPSGIRAD